jgi:hypothetical protein
MSSASSWITPAVSFVLGFVSAVFAEPVRSWILRPKLRVTFARTDDCFTPTRTAGGEKARWIRVKVENEKKRLAKGCRAYLVRIESKSPDSSEWVDTIYVDSIQLAWACRKEEDKYASVELPFGVAQYIDVVSAFKGKDNELVPFIQVQPLRYARCF